MPDYRVLWTDAARRDLEAIVDFIAEDNLDNAVAVLDRIETRANALSEHPERGRVVPELRAIDVFTFRELIAKPWRIVYRHESKRVYVMAVLDARRDLTSILLERLSR
jgi:plasmid stabilization system protein ParE